MGCWTRQQHPTAATHYGLQDSSFSCLLYCGLPAPPSSSSHMHCLLAAPTLVRCAVLRCAVPSCTVLCCAFLHPNPAGTPADKLLQMLTDLLDGTLPNLQDILLIQSSILEARDIYQPWRLGKQLLETKDLEVRGHLLPGSSHTCSLLFYPDCSACPSVCDCSASSR